MACLKLEILEQSFVPMEIVYKRPLAIDPLADQGGQQTLSPYHAMACNPALMVDPLGLLSNPNNDISSPFLSLKTPSPVYVPIKGSGIWNVINKFENIPILTPGEIARQEYISKLITAVIANEIFDGGGSVLYSGLFSGGSGGSQTNDGGDEKKKEYKTPYLNGRPPTRQEANLHYLYGNGEPLYVDLSKVDLLFLDATDFDEKVGAQKAIQTLWRSDDGRVFGNITLTYIGHDKVSSTYGFDKYDFEMHSWWNPLNWVRNVATIYGDPGNGTPFIIYFRGEGIISPLPTWRQKSYEIINQGFKFFIPNIPGQ